MQRPTACATEQAQTDLVNKDDGITPCCKRSSCALDVIVLIVHHPAPNDAAFTIFKMLATQPMSKVYKALIERGLCNDQYQLRLRSTQQVVHLQCSAREAGLCCGDHLELVCAAKPDPEPAASVRCNGCWQSWSLPYSEKPFYSHDWLCRTCSGVAGCSAQKNRLTDRYVLLDLGAGRAALGVVDYHSGGYADGEEAVPEACYGVKQYARQHGGRKRGRSELLMYTFGQLVGRDEHELGVTLLPERFRPMC